jgi:hypothetical protein
MKLGKVDYNGTVPPVEYRCTSCGVHGCKLWREYTVFLHDDLAVECVDCAGKSQKKDVSDVDTDGRINTSCGRSDAIGWRVPAVPTEEGDTYWGSVPHDGMAWWRRLPNRVESISVRSTDQCECDRPHVHIGSQINHMTVSSNETPSRLARLSVNMLEGLKR